MNSLSNYPPGHPTGIYHGEETQVFWCDRCNTLWTPEDDLKLWLQIKHNKQPLCPTCQAPLDVATCERCDKPATHIDVERDTNAAATFCSKHGG